MKRILSAALCCIITVLFIFSGKSVSADRVTNITDKLVIKEDTTVSAGETLRIKDGGELYVRPGVTLTVKGALKCNDGGAVYNKGRIIVSSSGTAVVSGKMKLMSGSVLKLKGRLSVGKSGIIKGSGSIDMDCDFSQINCVGTIKSKIVPPQPVTEDGVTTVGGVILVNKEYGLPEDYGSGLARAAYSAYVTMKKDSGYDMSIVSGFRSYEKQQQTYKYWCGIDGEATASRYSAKPGHSEHQTGLAMDISSLKRTYADTDEGKWLAENCWKYGFIIRYPKNSEKITGYVYEPWHVRYLGKSLAKMVHDSGLTLEEFFCVDR